jgi:serine/threonine-protein phosphatase 6 regulatory ankyrin repeat subunit B
MASKKPMKDTWNVLLTGGAEYGKISEVQTALENGADINFRDQMGGSALLNAAHAGHEDIVKFLIAKGADINLRSSYPDHKKQNLLHCACLGGLLWLVKDLINKGFDINEDDGFESHPNTPLDYALWGDHLEVVDFLLSKGAKNIPNKLEDSLLHLAGPKVTAYLLDKGMDPNVVNKNGETPLFYNGSNRDKTLAKLEVLLAHGAKVNVVNNYGDTPLLFYCYRPKEYQAIKLLLDHGANSDVNTDAKFKGTPLYEISIWNDLESVKLLVERGADPNKPNQRNGKTPLFMAARYGETEIIKYLLSIGADPKIKDKYGETAADETKDKEIKKLLM